MNEMRVRKSFKFLLIGLVCLALLGLKLFYMRAETESLRWVLAPTAFVSSLFCGMDFIYREGMGYLSTNGLYLINKSCSGVNFLILTLFISTFSLLSRKMRIRWQLVTAFLAGAASYLLTILSNSIRITLSILFEPFRRSIPLLEGAESWVHQGIGTFIFLLFLLIYYYMLMKGALWIREQSTK